MDWRDRTDQNRPVPPMPSRETTANVLGVCGIASGSPGRRRRLDAPGGAWQGVPGGLRRPPSSPPRPAGRGRPSRGSLAPCAGLLLPVGLLLAGAPSRECGLSPGRPWSRLALAGVAMAVAGSGLRPPRVLFLPLAFAVLAAAAGRTHARVGPEGDEPHYLMVAESLLRDGDLSLDRDYAEGRYDALPRRPARAALPGAGQGRVDLLAPRRRPVGPDPPRVGPCRVRRCHRLHGAPGGARRPRGARVGARADGPRHAWPMQPAGRSCCPRRSSTMPASCSRRCRRRSPCRSASGTRGGWTSGPPAPWPSASRRACCRGSTSATHRSPSWWSRTPCGVTLAPRGPRRPRSDRRLRGGVTGSTTRRSTGSGDRGTSTGDARSSRSRRSPRASPACSSTRSSACSCTPRCLALALPGFAFLWRQRSTTGDRGGRGRGGRAPDRRRLAHVAGRLRSSRALPGADRPPPRSRRGAGLGSPRAHGRRRAPPGLDALDRPRRCASTRSSFTAIGTGRRLSSGSSPGRGSRPVSFRRYVLARPGPRPSRGRVGPGDPGGGALAHPGGRRRGRVAAAGLGLVVAGAGGRDA